MNVDALLRDYDGAVPGASVLVIKNGNVVVRKSYGMANLEDRIAATPATNYRLASLTKAFTAASILILQDRGKLSLDDPITKYLPLPPYANAITIKHLITHRSGLLAYEDLIPPGTTRQLKDADVLDLLAKESTTYFPPGTEFRYSNTGYAFLALIVERVSGQRFAAFLRENIFERTGMRDTVAFEEGISTVAHRAYGYTQTNSGWTRTDQSLTSAVLGDGGIYTSIDDMVHWMAWIDTGRYNQALTANYGLGWRIGMHRGQRYFWHNGETIGFTNAIARFPDQHLTVLVLTNRNDREVNTLALAIADLYFG